MGKKRIVLDGYGRYWIEEHIPRLFGFYWEWEAWPSIDEWGVVLYEMTLDGCRDYIAERERAGAMGRKPLVVVEYDE